MAKRKQLFHPDIVRQKIRTSQLINRLTDHVNSEKPLMDSSQVQAARILLAKAIPDLSTTTLRGDESAPLQQRVSVAWEAIDVKQIEHKSDSDS